MNYIVDIVLLALLILIIVRGAKRGFVSTLLDSLSVLGSGIASYILCQPVSQFIYDKFISPVVKSHFTDALKNTIPPGASLSQKIDGLVNSLPLFVRNLAEYAGIDVKGYTAQVGSSAVKSAEQIVDTVADTVAYNILIFFTRVVVFLLMFVLFAFIIRKISDILSKLLDKIPLVGSLNKGLGGVLGLVKAAVIILAVCTVLYFVIGSTANFDLISAVDASKIYTYVTEYNPILKIF